MRLKAFMMVACFFAVFGSFAQAKFEQAKQQAHEQHKLILLNFSGSDWCGPCIKLKKDFLEIPAFQQFSDSTLVFINADFPRQKKHQLSKEEQQQNDLLAEHYNAKGAFPFTVLLDENGRPLKSWEGYPKEKPEEFIDEIQTMANAINSK